MTAGAVSSHAEYTAAYELWVGAVGSIAYGRLAKALKDPIQRYGWARVEAALREYIANNDGRRRIEYFAQDFHHWDQEAQQPLSDGLDLTPKGQRIWHELNRRR